MRPFESSALMFLPPFSFPGDLVVRYFRKSQKFLTCARIVVDPWYVGRRKEAAGSSISDCGSKMAVGNCLELKDQKTVAEDSQLMPAKRAQQAFSARWGEVFPSAAPHHHSASLPASPWTSSPRPWEAAACLGEQFACAELKLRKRRRTSMGQ